MKPLILFTILFVIFIACNNKEQEGILSEQPVQIDSMPGECPFLTKDVKGRTVMSWVRMINDSTTAFCYASTNDGKTFNAPVVIPASNHIQPHGENLPKLIFKPSGEIIALWGEPSTNKKNKYAGMVFYVQSFDSGKTWTAARPLVGDAAGYDQRFYDVALLPNGEAGIIWLDNRKSTTKEGSALYYASTDGKNGFRAERKIAESCCQCCRTDLFVDSKGGIHTLYRGILQDSIRDMVHCVSVDGGKTFSAPQKISNDNWVVKGCPHTGPAMTENKDGLHFAWFTGGRNRGSFYTKSTDNGKTFIGHDSVSSLGSHPQLAPLSNGELLIAWDESKVVGNKAYKKIGIQRRAADGKSESKTFITPDDGDASYPVVTTLNEHSSMVAYTKTEGGKPYVACQIVKLD